VNSISKKYQEREYKRLWLVMMPTPGISFVGESISLKQKVRLVLPIELNSDDYSFLFVLTCDEDSKSKAGRVLVTEAIDSKK